MSGSSSTAGPAAAAAAGAPARKALAPKDKKRWNKLVADTEKLEQLKEDSAASRFYDHAAPGTRNARARTRARFEEFVECVFEVTEIPDIWNSATIIERTKQFLGGLAVTSNGLFTTKIKASSLWIAKHCVYWWAVRFIPDFSTVYHDWHARTVEHVHYIATKEGLSTEFHEKHNLTDVELALIFQHIMQIEYGVDNMKQHFVAMMLAWTTSARPGTFTVSKGYGQGVETGIADIVRKAAQTLYWKDVDFRRLDDGTIAARVTLRYHKGYRNPHAEETLVDSSRKFTFMPTVGTRYEFDLSLLLVGLAWNRGLFSAYDSLAEIINGEDAVLKLDENIQEQAIFVAANQAGGIDASKPMNSGALNPKLQDLCISIGLLARNTYYSFRRTAIVETRRVHGSEAARDLAFHKPGSDSIFSYDDVGFGDVDLTAYRLGLEEQTMSRDEIRRFFGQARFAYDSTTSTAPDLRRSLKIRVDEAKVEDPQFIEVEVELARIYESLGTKIQALKDNGQIDAAVAIPLSHASKASTIFHDLAIKYGFQEDLAELDQHLKHRKSVHKAVRNRLTNEVKKQIAEEQKKALKINKTKARRYLPGKGFEPQGLVKGADKHALDQITQAATASLDIEQIEPLEGDEEDAPLNLDALDMHQERFDARGEPSAWHGLDEDVVVRVDRDDDEEADENHAAKVNTTERNKFLLAWANKADSIVPNANLRCDLCLSDDTQTETAKNRKYSLAKLNIHLGSATHSRRSQILRAFNLDAETQKASTIRCPICGLGNTGRGSASSKFIAHIEEHHPEELWETDTEPDSMEVEESDAEEEYVIAANEDEDASTGRGSEEQPVESYTGKGKGRAAVQG